MDQGNRIKPAVSARPRPRSGDLQSPTPTTLRSSTSFRFAVRALSESEGDLALHGEVWLADLGISAKMRPVVVVSRYDEDPPRVLVIYVPLTSEDRGSQYEVQMPKLPFLRLEGVANVQGIADARHEGHRPENKPAQGNALGFGV